MIEDRPLIYKYLRHDKKFPHVWTVTDARAIIDPWRGDLNFEEI